jgi:hypothetical protein
LVIVTVRVAALTREAVARKADTGRDREKNKGQTGFRIEARGVLIDIAVYFRGVSIISYVS